MIRKHPARFTPAFTLIELIVVMGVMSVVLILTAVLSSQAIDLRSATKARIVAGRNAAAFMRQFEADLTQRITRSEARTHFDKQTGNDEISLLTQRPGYSILTKSADRRASLVSYRIERQMLERAASGYGFGSSNARPDEKSGTLALVQVPLEGPPAPDERAYQVIAPGLIRLEFSFLIREGNTQVMRADPPRDQELIEAVVATVVTLDPDRSRMLKEADFRLITTEFRDARDNELPAGEWTETAANLSRKLPNLPKSALQQVRVYQGVFPLPNRKPKP
jgi:prepilin-type N-terminal cleavage/methylation domain-containing protein